MFLYVYVSIYLFFIFPSSQCSINLITGHRDNLSGIGKGMYFSTVNSLCVKKDQTIVARCSTCLVSFRNEESSNEGILLLSSLGTRIPPHADIPQPPEYQNTYSSSSSSSSNSSPLAAISAALNTSNTADAASHPVFLENGFQIRGALSPDEKYFLCPSSCSPWNGDSCTLVLDSSLQKFVEAMREMWLINK